jgi:hypothetical protein
VNGPSAAVDAVRHRMSKESVLIKLRRARIYIVEEYRNGNDNGWSFRTDAGAIVTLYDAGRLVVQGKNTRIVREAMG